MRKKNPNIAFLFSFLIPGAGLAYLGMIGWGFANLATVVMIGIMLASLLAPETARAYGMPIALGLAGGSAGLARAVAKHSQ